MAHDPDVLRPWSPDEIRQVRARFGKAKDFAQFIGVTPEHLSRLEHGARPPSRTLSRLFTLLDQNGASDAS